MKRLLPLVGLLLIVPALSGCLTAQATAMQYQDSAHARADQWDSDAQLAQVVGVEGAFGAAMSGSFDWDYSGSGWSGWDGWQSSRSSGSQMTASQHMEKSYWAEAREDPNVGDGRCKFWIYEFVADGKDETFIVVVDEDGEIVDTGTSDKDSDDVALGDYNVDSDRALQIAKENNEGIREGSQKDNFGLAQVLDREPDQDNPRWTVVGAGADESGGGGGVVVIDAVTGEVLESHGGSSATYDSGSSSR